MKPYGKIGLCVLAAAVMGGGCGSPPPPVPPKPKPTAKPKPEPPPPPKCESLEEGCQSSSDTLVKIALAEHVFHPPNDWEYARGARATLTQVNDQGPVLALTSFTPESDDKKLKSQRTEALVALAKMTEVELPDTEVNFDKPQQEADVAGLKMQYWQLEKAKRADRTGSLLVLMADLDDRKLFGLGYVPDDDQSEADRIILEALESIKAAGDSNQEADSDEKGDS